MERLAPTIVQHDSGLELLVVDRVAARPDEVQQVGRLACLPLHVEAVARQPLNQGWQSDIAKTLIVRPGLWKAYGRTRAGLGLERHVRDGTPHEQRLQVGLVRFHQHQAKGHDRGPELRSLDQRLVGLLGRCDRVGPELGGIGLDIRCRAAGRGRSGDPGPLCRVRARGKTIDSRGCHASSTPVAPFALQVFKHYQAPLRQMIPGNVATQRSH